MKIVPRTSWHGRVRGVTLVEMLVAVSITVMMLMVTGIVFKSSSEASGKAAALNEMMRQVRAITRQLESDLAGLRSDMPMAIMFEAHRDDPDDGARLVRYDRIAFFANGDFQTMDGGGSGNMARIFYGQAWDMPRQPADTIDPPRKILTRRCKIMTAVHHWLLSPVPSAWPQNSIMLAAQYDNTDMECASVAFWKNEPFVKFASPYFNDDLSNIVSFVRRPNIAAVEDAIVAMSTIGGDAVQKLYMLPDVTDFRIQVGGLFGSAWRWYPEPANMFDPSGALVNQAFYWNAPANPFIGPMKSFPLTANGITINWYSDTTLAYFTGIPNPWPSAIKFTFTLYDKDRRHFPEGKTFTYVVNLPKRV